MPEQARIASRDDGGGRLHSCALGVEVVDAWLNGGLEANGLHEFHATAPDDLPAALDFALLVAWRRGHMGQGEARKTSHILWLRAPSRMVPYGPGLAELGVDPAQVTLLLLKEAKALLRAAHDGVRAGLTTVLLELHGRQPLLDLTATRRLLLAAEASGTMILMVRNRAEPMPSAAHSRWRVGSAPSRPLEAGAPGLPAFALTLDRRRGGPDGLSAIVEWDRDTASFHARQDDHAATPLSGGAPTLAGSGERPDSRHRAA